MVLILSAEDDYSTNDVIDWLIHFNIEFIRISSRDSIVVTKVCMYNNKIDINFTVNNKPLRLSQLTSFWYRRSHLNLLFDKISIDMKLDSSINNHLFLEFSEIKAFFIKELANIGINRYEDIFLNKLIVLAEAAKTGLKIPSTIIANTKEDVFEFAKRYKAIITKNISQGIFIFHKDTMLTSTTILMNEKYLDMLEENFAYTLFQEYIEKEIELRIFYLKGKFYSSAIFSQNDPKTIVDFRNYNFEKPNRIVPFKLPRVIEERLCGLMLKIGLNCGSIDMIYSKNKEYYFLEVNPIGQFAQVSQPCNYYLEEKIAEILVYKI
nr:grasp-with-spasm system ATP-grasp peptide maturase [uncultured Flavobacterium sp.]